MEDEISLDSKEEAKQWWVGDARSDLWIFVSNILEISFTEEGTGAENDVFEGGLNFVDSRTMKKFYSTASAV